MTATLAGMATLPDLAGGHLMSAVLALLNRIPSELLYCALRTSTEIEVSPLQPSNVEFPRLVTEDGIATLVRLVQAWNAEFPMPVTPSGRTIADNSMHELKAKLPMLVTPAGRVMPVRLTQKSNASLPMAATGFPSMVDGITITPEASSMQSVIVIEAGWTA